MSKKLISNLKFYKKIIKINRILEINKCKKLNKYQVNKYKN